MSAPDGSVSPARLFAAIDAKDTEAFLQFLTDDALFRFGSAQPVTGQQRIREAVDGFFASIAGLRHVVDCEIRQGDTLVCEGTATYTRHDGSRITLPFANVFGLDGERISEYKIYVDIGPLYENKQ